MGLPCIKYSGISMGLSSKGQWCLRGTTMLETALGVSLACQRQRYLHWNAKLETTVVSPLRQPYLHSIVMLETTVPLWDCHFKRQWCFQWIVMLEIQYLHGIIMLETAVSLWNCHIRDSGVSTLMLETAVSSCGCHVKYMQWCLHGTVMLEAVVVSRDCHVKDRDVFMGLPCQSVILESVSMGLPCQRQRSLHGTVMLKRVVSP